jgi:stage V sporulation protein B
MPEKKLFKTMAWVTGFSCLTRVLAFGFKIYLSRLLGAEVLGLFQISLSFFMLLACFSATGLPLTLSKKTAENMVTGNTKRAHQVFSSTLVTSVLTATAFVLIFYTFPNILGYIFADPRVARIFLFMLPALITTSVYCVTRAWFWGKKDYIVFSGTETLDEILKIAFAAFFISSVFTFPKEIGLAIAFVAADFVCGIVLFAIFFKKKGRLVKPQHFPEVIKAAAPITGTRILASFTTSMTALLLPVVLVHYGMTVAGATAAYGRAAGMVMPIIFAPNSIIGALSIVLLPEIAGLRVRGEEKKLNTSINNALLAACFIGCAFFAVFFSSGIELGLFLYNDVFAGQYLVFAAALTIPMSLNNIALTSLNTLGHEDKGFFSNLVGLSILAAVTFSTASVLGIFAYFAGLMAYHFTTVIINLILLKKYAKIKLSGLKRMPAMFAVSALALVAGRGVHSLTSHHLSNPVLVLVVTSSVLLTYTLVAAITGLANFRKWFFINRAVAK